MLNRNDLAKQFELVVKQEIKNFKSSLNFILESLREIRNEIVVIKASSEEIKGASLAKHGMLAIEIQNLKKEFTEAKQKLDRFINDQSQINDRNVYKNSEIKTTLNEHQDFQQYFLKRINSFETSLASFEENLKEKDGKINEITDATIQKFVNSLDRAKIQVFENVDNKFIEVKNSLEEKIVCHNVDVAGIMRELAVHKKTVMILEKKIEHLYTLIARQQA